MTVQDQHPESFSAIAVIGGTGMNQWPGFAMESRIAIETPYGVPSAELLAGHFAGTPVIFLPRHGEGHRYPPHVINYRANLWALKEAGVKAVIGVAAVGSIAEWFAPGEIAIPDDVIDYTWGREHTYSDGSPNAPFLHVEFTQPYAAELRNALSEGAARADVTPAGAGVMAVAQGPRLESAAEIRRMVRDGADMVGMTSMPEASLAAELGLQYASLAVSVNWAAGIGGAGSIHAEIERWIADGMHKAQATLGAMLPVWADNNS